MPRSSPDSRGRARSRRPAVLMAVLIGLALASPVAGGAQPAAATPTAAEQALAARVQSRFDVLPVQHGIVLTPRTPRDGVKSIEIASGNVAINGVVVTGGELRARLGSDADMILRLTYLSSATRQALFGLTPPAGTGGSSSVPPPAPVPPPSPAPAASTPPPPSGPPVPPVGSAKRSGDQVRIGGDVTVERGEMVEGDVVVIGGTARVDGDVEGQVTVVGGLAHIGPDAHVRGDVTVVAGTLDRSPDATIDGKVNVVGFGTGVLRGRPFPHVFFMRPFFDGLPFTFIGVFATVFRIALLILLASLVVLLAQRPVELIGARAAAEPFKAGLIGLAAELLFLPVLVLTIVILAVTIIGIPLLVLVPFAIVALLIVFLVGFTGVAYQVGRWLDERLGWHLRGPYLPTIMGIVVIVALTMAGRLAGTIGGFFELFAVIFVGLGALVEWAAWTTGFGAAVLVRFGARPAPAAPGGPALPVPPGPPVPPAPPAGPSGI